MAGNDPGVEQADAMAVFDQAMSAATPCATAWEEVGLSNLRPSLDEQALAIAEHQESSLESRRALAAQAKSFRGSVEAEVGATSDMRAASGALVRAFKGEIDALTTRSRFAEGAFLALYKLLREAPDPAVTVQALEKTARAAVEALEGRNRSLEERKREMSHQLEAARAATARGNSLTAEELQEERRVLRAEIAADQAETEQLRLQALQDAVQEELLLAQGQAEHERAAAQAQQQVLQQEVERLEARAALVEEEAGRSRQLEEEAAAGANQLRALQEKVESLEAENKALAARARIAAEGEQKAVADLAEARARADGVERSSVARVRDLENEATQLRRQLETGANAAQVEGMREKIRILEGIWGDAGGVGNEGGAGMTRRQDRRQGDVDQGEAGQETDRDPTHQPATTTAEARGGGREGGLGGERLQRGERLRAEDGSESGTARGGGGGDRDLGAGDDGGGADGQPGDRSGVSGGAASTGAEAEGGEVEPGEEDGRDAGVDAWLISYNRRLKNELERLRERTRQAEDRLERVEKERVADGAELADRRQDVKRLEQDLVDAHQVVEAGKTMLRAFQSGPVAKQFGKLVGRGAVAGGVVAQGSLEDDLLGGGVEDGGGEEGVSGPEGFSAADRLLGAVKRQRERFRKEALRREREASIAKGNAEQLTRDNQDLRRENMHLYKKIRHVLGFYGGKGGGLEGAGGDGEQETESKYREVYEADLDPFKEFDSQEKETRRGQMGFLERWLFWASGNALRNRFRRHLLLVYLLVLHGLLIVLPGGGRGRTLGFGAGSGSDVAGGLMP
ncbi:unnamed protein product [Pylaiella littoralis]